MNEPPLRVLFCIGINQNFFDLPTDGLEPGHVWQAFTTVLDGIKTLPSVSYIGDMDDDSHVVGPSTGWPWTCYVLADVADEETVKAACNLFRTTPVGDGGAKLWRFTKVEARMGRALTVREDVELPREERTETR